MPDDNQNDHEMESLSRAIVKAIMKSNDVRKAIRKLSETEDSNSKSFMVFMLRVQHLADSMDFDTETCKRGEGEFGAFDEFQTSHKSGDSKRIGKLEDVIDGKKESANEKAFREFLAKKFDQNSWLRNNGLIF